VDGDDELRQRFAEFGTQTSASAPLYGRLAAAIADDPATVRLLLHAPPPQRLPVLLFACVHWLLINEPEHELRRWYPNLVAEPATDDPYPAFRRLCAQHEPRLASLLSARSTQTNEVGRCALFVPALAELEDERGPLALVDVGASGGLNLLLDSYQYRYDPGGIVGTASPVLLPCGVRGRMPVPLQLPAIAARIGLDRAPVDITDPAEATWLEACVWPDQTERFHRLEAAIALARSAPPLVRRGDAVGDLASTVNLVRGEGHPVVTNSWVLNYLTPAERAAYLGELDRIGSETDISWVYAESPVLTAPLPAPAIPGREAERTALTLVRWRDGRRIVTHLATCHPHGAWIHWFDHPVPTSSANATGDPSPG
jgi:hypothetical protein